ncbi:MAG: dipeptide epimerase [Candidatus Latescibacterota bacterium]|nr:MAG: dipeptide epimerase [Candidatus Latescibacterota bacterium]
MKLEVESVKLKPHHPFRISREVQRERDVFVFALTWEGITGLGEASPSPYYGEDSGTVPSAVRRIKSKLDGDPERVKERVANGDLRKQLDRHASVRAALDMALWDIIGKRENRPVYAILGLDPTKTPATSFTIGIDAPEVIDRKVDEAEPYRILKMKMGLPGDVALLDRVLERSGKIVRVDANEGWDVETALQMCGELSQKGIEFVEQPIHHDNEEDLRTLKRLSPLPVILDESIINPDDVSSRRDQGHGINVKLMKCGGITPALALIDEARRADLKVMLGCMMETSVGITAAAHLSPLADYADLDGNLLVANDPFLGVTVQNSKLVLPDGPGLGVVRRETS